MALKYSEKLTTNRRRICYKKDRDKLQKWSDSWLLKFHPNKCKVMTVTNKSVGKQTGKYHLYDSNGREVKLEQSEGEKDIGVKQSIFRLK